MLVLFETPAGYATFKVLDEGKLRNVDDLYKEFETPELASQFVKLQAFQAFPDTDSALAAANALNESKLGKDLKSFLKKKIVKKGITDQLAVFDPKLGSQISKKLKISCVADSGSQELMRGIRSQLETLITGAGKDLGTMALGLSHLMSRHKIQFSPDKVDTMIIQAVSLLDDVDKELNTYSMRVKEWYGWHYPEMQKIVLDNLQYSQVVSKMGTRDHCKHTDFSDILDEDVEKELKSTAEISMGSDITEQDILNIQCLCTQVIEIGSYRASLWEYLRNRMNAIAPNLSVMVGELVGARLISHAGSLVNLAKAPASTVQIFGAEKALFRALKTKHETPKYGLIFHASMVGRASAKAKGKISRMLAAKTALCIRVDALGDTDGPSYGIEARAKLEQRVMNIEGGGVAQASNGIIDKSFKQEKYAPTKTPRTYNAASDVVDTEMTDVKDEVKVKKEKKDKKKKDKKEKKKRKREESESSDAKVKVESDADSTSSSPSVDADAEPSTPSQKKRKKDKKEKSSKKKKKKAERYFEEGDASSTPSADAAPETPKSEKKKKKKDKSSKKKKSKKSE